MAAIFLNFNDHIILAFRTFRMWQLCTFTIGQSGYDGREHHRGLWGSQVCLSWSGSHEAAGYDRGECDRVTGKRVESQIPVHIDNFFQNTCANCPYLTLMAEIYRMMYVLEWRTVYALTKWLFWCLFPELRSNEGNKHQNNTRVSTQTVHYKSTYHILFLTWYDGSMNDNKNNYLHTSSLSLTRLVYVLLMMSKSIAANVKMTRQ